MPVDFCHPELVGFQLTLDLLHLGGELGNRDLQIGTRPADFVARLEADLREALIDRLNLGACGINLAIDDSDFAPSGLDLLIKKLELGAPTRQKRKGAQPENTEAQFQRISPGTSSRRSLDHTPSSSP